MKRKISKVYSSTQPKRAKHVPQRTCIACRHTGSKREFVRLVCVNGVVEVDLKGKKPGRGVYLCASRRCWDAGIKGNRLEYGLRTKLSGENQQSLVEYGNTLALKERI